MEETGQATLIGRRRGQSYSSHRSPFSVWKSSILALTRHLMSNYLWTCQFQQGFCVFKYTGSMTKTPSWSSVLKSLRSLCFKCSGLFAHFTDEKLSIRGCHLPGKQLASGIGIQMQVSWLLLGRSSPSTERKGQPWLHGLGITVCLKQFWATVISISLCNLFHDDYYWPSALASHSDKSEALAPLKQHPSKCHWCIICFPLGIAPHASNIIWILQPPCFLLFHFLS